MLLSYAINIEARFDLLSVRHCNKIMNHMRGAITGILLLRNLVVYYFDVAIYGFAQLIRHGSGPRVLISYATLGWLKHKSRHMMGFDVSLPWGKRNRNKYFRRIGAVG